MQTSPVANLWLRTLTGAGVMVIVCVIGSTGYGSTILTMLDDEGTCLSAVGGGKGCAVFVNPFCARGWRRTVCRLSTTPRCGTDIRARTS